MTADKIHTSCPGCKKQHADEGEWATRPHKTHRCVDDAAGKGCGQQWTPAPHPTVGVLPVIKWVKGPLGEPASEDWRYWVPKTGNGTYLAWYFPTGLPTSGDDDKLLGEDLPTVEAAQALCEAHLRGDPPAVPPPREVDVKGVGTVSTELLGEILDLEYLG